MLRFFPLALCIIITSTSCSNRKVLENDIDKPNISKVFSDDVEMNAAILKARSTFDVFDSVYNSGIYSKENFFLKIRFKNNNGGEHIWANNITHDSGFYFGTLDEDAISIDSIKKGIRVKVKCNNLSDWLYDANGIMMGGYTIKAIRNKMTAKERAHFDSTYYLKIIE